MDFMSDRLGDGRRYRILTLVDNFSRVSPALEVDFSLPGKRVVQVLERLAHDWGLPEIIHCDNGSEFISWAMDEWAHRNGVKLDFSRPGKPTDNCFVESFNGKLRSECLNQHWFESIQEARATIEAWRHESNQERPHRALHGQTPLEFLHQWNAQQAAKKPPDLITNWTSFGFTVNFSKSSHFDWTIFRGRSTA